MSTVTVYEAAILNLRKRLKKQHSAYLSVEETYELLKKRTKQDFGLDAKAWEAWLKDNRLLDKNF